MARIVKLSLSPQHVDSVVEAVQRLDGVIGLRLDTGASLQPPGDVIEVQVTNRALHPLVRLLEHLGVIGSAVGSMTTSAPLSVLGPSAIRAEITRDTSESTWEEMEMLLAKESNMSANALLFMAVAGGVAAVGLATNALHLVIAAMVIAPGFEPLARISLGAVARSRAWRRGLVDVVKGYSSLILGVAAAALLLSATGTPPLGGTASYLEANTLVSYFTSFSASSFAVSTIAALAGAVFLASNRSTLTAGVMIALALVPTAALVGSGLAVGAPSDATAALLRWTLDACIVVAATAVVYAWKRARVHRRVLRL